MTFYRSALAVVSACSFLVLSCRREEKDAPNGSASAAAAAVTVPSAVPPVPSGPALSLVDAGITVADEETHDLDAGTDAGRRRRRRVAGAAIDASAPDEQHVASPADAEAPPPPVKPRRAGMGDDQPYGGSAPASSSAVLKKQPLPSDNPWR